MSAFPSLPGLDIAVKRSEIFSTAVQASASGKELRAAYTATPRYRYELTFNYLRQAGFSAQTASDELATLKAFFDSVYGRWGTFTYTDPVDGTARTCRFDQDNLDLERIVVLAWKGAASLSLITVK